MSRLPGGLGGGGGDDLPHRDQVAGVDDPGGHVGCQGLGVAGLVGVLHQVGGADLGGRVGRLSDADPHLEVAVAVEDVVGAAALEGVGAQATEKDVPVAPHRAAQRARARCRGCLDGAERGARCREEAPRPAIRSMPSWSRTSQPVKPAPPTALGTTSSPRITSLNAEPELASISCHRSRLTTTGSGTPTRFRLMFMSSSAPTVSYWWVAQSKPAAPANRSMAALDVMMSSPPSAS